VGRRQRQCRPESFDKVLALESAFHFDTRKISPRAYRVVRPGGSRSADIAPSPALKLSSELARRRLAFDVPWRLHPAGQCIRARSVGTEARVGRLPRHPRRVDLGRRLPVVSPLRRNPRVPGKGAPANASPVRRPWPRRPGHPIRPFRLPYRLGRPAGIAHVMEALIVKQVQSPITNPDLLRRRRTATNRS
jgi:hypothetical protein